VGGWEEKGVEWPKGSMRLERCGVGGGGSVVGQWGGCGFFSSAPFCSAPMGSRLCHSRALPKIFLKSSSNLLHLLHIVWNFCKSSAAI